MKIALQSLQQAWTTRAVSSGQLAGLTFVFLWFFIGGIMHFVASATEARIVPPYIPWPQAAVLISGVFELLGAAGIVLRRTRRSAGVGLFLLTLAVTPAHIYMLQRPELFNVPLWALWLRLPIQVVLLALIVWSTWRDRRPTLAA
ncbi:DoxX family protein [Massilia sp. TSP1-1-2]|uniref:DoxX family protein n=1 Tax=unclassified Massilia TaxID=2609279 RepID=UPI003CF8F27B